MIFKQLTEISNERNRKYELFEKLLKDFQSNFQDQADFDLQYADSTHLIVITDCITGYTKDIHDILCKVFKVKLTYVNQLNQQSAMGDYLSIEYIYQDVDDKEEEIKWEAIKWR